MKELELKNPMAVPRLHKVVINMGVGEATQNAKVLDPAAALLQHIEAQAAIGHDRLRVQKLARTRAAPAQRRDIAGRCDPLYAVVVRVGDIQVALMIDGQPGRRGELAEAEPAVPGWRMAVDEMFSE